MVKHAGGFGKRTIRRFEVDRQRITNHMIARPEDLGVIDEIAQSIIEDAPGMLIDEARDIKHDVISDAVRETLAPSRAWEIERTTHREEENAMKRLLLALVLTLAAQSASAQAPTVQVDPSLVGMWQLQWAGPQMLWQVRADGVPPDGRRGAAERAWGRMQASGGKWSSAYERGKDAGSYQLQGNNWSVTGWLGTGVWQRIWPSPQAVSTATCPHIDVAAVESHLASALKGRMVQNTCELSATRVGIPDGVSVTSEIMNQNKYYQSRERDACANRTNADPNLRCVTGLGDVAFFRQGTLHIYQGNRSIAIGHGVFPRTRPSLTRIDRARQARARPPLERRQRRR